MIFHRNISQKKIIVKLRKKFTRKEILKEDINVKLWRKILDIIMCILVRLVFIGECIFAIYYVIGITNNLAFVSMIVPIILIILDGIYVSIFRLGKEHSW